MERYVFLGISTSKGPVGHHYPWWHVGIFYHILYGFVFPLSVLYIFEVWIRIQFIKKMKPSIPQEQFLRIPWDSAGCMALASIVFLQMVWAILVELQA